MKKISVFVLTIVLVLSMCISASATVASSDEDAVYYGKAELSDVNQASYTVVEISDENTAMVADEDTVYYGINELNPEDFILVSPETMSNARASYIRLEFPNALSGSIYSDFIENIIKDGASATLKVDTCVWAPESYDLEIGIYNWSTAENWYVVKEGGKIIDYSKTFSNLTAGMYSVYVLNRGGSSLTTGYLLYNLS